MGLHFAYNSECLTEENLVRFWHDVGWEGKSDKYSDRLLSAMQNSAYIVTVWDDDKDELLGLCACMSNGMQVYISQLAVVKRLQGQGLGSALIKDVVKHFKNCEIILITQYAKKFYLKNGFHLKKYDVLSVDNRG